jgi:hypothetical protein
MMRPHAPRRELGTTCRLGALALICVLAAASMARAGAAPNAPPAATANESTGAQTSSTLYELMALLAQRRHREADFQETKYVAVLNQPLESSGTLVYDAPDHLEQRVEHPRSETVLLDHGMLTLRVGSRTRSVPLADSAQLAPLIDSLRALLAGDRTALEQRFKLNFSGSLAQWQLRLEPRDERLSATVRLIDIRGEHDAIRELQLSQSNGDHSIMLIQPRP